MPTPRTPPLQTKKDAPKVDLGKQCGLYDTPDLRDKVLKWQTPPKPLSPAQGKAKPVENPVDDFSKQTPNKTQEQKNHKDKESTAEMNGLVKALPVAQEAAENETSLEQDLRAASAPKRRVVSDEHWKKGRPSSANKPSQSPKLATPEKVPGHDFYMRPGSNTYDAWVRRKSTPAKVSTPRDKAVASPTTPNRKSSQPKPAISPVAKKEVVQEPNKDSKLAIQDTSPSAKKKTTPTKEQKNDQSRIVSATGPIVVNEVSAKSASPQPRKSSQEKQKLQASSPAQAPPKASAVPKKPATRASPTPLKTITKPSEARSDDEALAAHIAETRVDAWLTNTPDPFIDDGDSDWSDAELSSPIEVANTAHVVKPLSIRVRKVETRKSTGQHEQSEDISYEAEASLEARSRPTRLDSEARPDHPNKKDSDYFSAKDRRAHEKDLSDDSSSEFSTPTTPTLKRSKATRKMVSPRRNARGRSASILESVTLNAPTETSTSFAGSTVDAHNRKTSDENTNPWYRDKMKNHGNRLTTIASVETISTLMQDPAPVLQYTDPRGRSHPARVSPPHSDVAEPSDVESKKRPRMARKMTSHADLISVLSMADEDGEALPTAHSVRSCRSKLGPANLGELMDELKSDETKYIRELRTMVDGVVPVLLNSVVSKSSSAVAAGLFNNLKTDANATTLIMNIGVALERLKSAHQRMPTSSSEALLMWAQGSYRIYADYLQAWRMGFQDIVVTLAPAEKQKSANGKFSETLPKASLRSRDGYTVDGDGGKVDVAYLLKRPLVRLKYLARTLKNIDGLAPSEQAKLWASNYQDLVEEARRRQDEERARLEDRAASSIDATRTREPQTLAPLTGVRINPSRCVRARDFFTLKLQHSSGQRIDCGVELLLRDNAPGLGDGGDVLICEVDSTSKWLLFPPVQISQISARSGGHDEELVAMIRGQDANGLEWYELLTLKAGNPLISHEWIQLLGEKPVPPPSRPLNQSSLGKEPVESTLAGAIVLANPTRVRTPSQMVVDVPIGEKADGKAKQWRSQSSMLPEPNKQSIARPSTEYFEDDYAPPKSRSMPGSPTASQVSHSWRQNFSPGSVTDNIRDSSISQPRNILHPSRSPLPSPPPPPPHHTSPANIQVHHDKNLSRELAGRRGPSPPRSAVSRSSSYTVWHPQQGECIDDSDDECYNGPRGASTNRPGMERRISSTPNETLPFIPRVRMISPSRTSRSNEATGAPLLPHSPANRYGTPSQQSSKSPLHTPSLMKGGSAIPSVSGTPTSSTQRRSSSPLKREYRPSSDSDSSSAMGDIQSDDDESITSDSSADDMFSHLQMPAGLFKPRMPSGSVYSPQSPETLTPSQSASQGPYRTVPPQEKLGVKMIASLFCWSDKGCWESIHPDECSIVVSPGLIEAFEMSAAHSKFSAGGQRTEDVKPLVGLELTPLVPLRRGTALDISIRSPPTANSLFRAGNNIMFRSRTGQECEILYGHINQARINNPTYIALQNARGPFGGGTWSSYMDHRANMRNHSAWWRFGSKKSSYRKTTTLRSGGNSSSMGQTESSVGTISTGTNTNTNTAMSALRRISAGSKVFNVAKSTVSSRGRISGSSTTFTSSSGSSGTLDAAAPRAGPPTGLTNSLHIRLYLRETASKWRDMGAARLTIMHPPTAGTMLSPHKRILITGKTRGETLLDVVLGESCFERVARTGIAVNIWEETRGPNGEVGVVGKTGGVVGGKGRVFMIQLKSEAETAYTFSLVGRLRY